MVPALLRGRSSSPSMRHERLYDVRWALVKKASFAYLDMLDKAKLRHSPQVVIGVAVLFLLICERFGLNVRAVLDTADRVLRRARDVEPMYPRGIAEYLRKELGDG